MVIQVGPFPLSAQMYHASRKYLPVRRESPPPQQRRMVSVEECIINDGIAGSIKYYRKYLGGGLPSSLE